MTMYSWPILVLICVSAVLGRDYQNPFCRDEISYATLKSKVEKATNYVKSNFKGIKKKNLLNGLSNVKKHLTKLEGDLNAKISSSDAISSLGEMMDTFNTALPKFKSQEPSQILSGIGDIMLTLGSLSGGPSGLLFMTFGGLMSNVFGLYKGEDLESAIEKVLVKVIIKERDTITMSTLHGIKDKYCDSKVRLDYHRGKASEIGNTTLELLIANVEDTKILDLGKIQFLIKTGADTYEEGERRINIISMYTDLIMIRNMLLVDLALFVEETKLMQRKPGEINAVRESYFGNYRKTLRFMRSQDGDLKKNYLVLAAFHPIQKSPINRKIDAFLNYIGLPKQEFTIPSSTYYLLTPDEYDSWYISACGDPLHAKACATKYKDSKYIRFKDAGQGYYYLSVEGFPTSDRSTRLAMMKTDPGDRKVTVQISKWALQEKKYKRFYLIPKSATADKFLIGVEGFPGYFVFMGSDNTIRIYEKDPTKQGYWSLIPLE